MKNYLNYFSEGTKIIRTFKNFPIFFEHLLGYIKEQKFHTIEVILWGGTKFKIRADNPTPDREVIQDIWLKNNYRINKNYLSSKGTVIDIGAHIGVFSVYAALLRKDILVYSYDPEPLNFSFLKQNIAINKLENNIKPFQLCVCGSSGIKLLYEGKSSSGHTIVPNDLSIKKQDRKVHQVQCITLEQIFLKEQVELCDFLKIDCEGCEYDILLKTPARIFKKMKRISLEYHDGFTEHNHKELVELLEKEKFNVKIVKSNSPKLLPYELGYLYAVNKRFI